MAPGLRRAWGLCGVTPTLAVRARYHETVSGIGTLTVSPRRRRVTLALALHPNATIRGPHVLRVLRQLRRHVRGAVGLLWDQGRPHTHQDVREWLGTHPRWHPVWLPPYAPALNPAEQLWTYLKDGRLANVAPDDVADIRGTVTREQRRLARRPDLLKRLFRHSARPCRV